MAGYALSQGFDTLERLHMRVGALPQYPANALKYNLTWSVDGLINEYLHPCEAIVRRTQDGAASAGRLRDLRARRRALRGVQYLRRAGNAGGDARRQGPAILTTRPSATPATATSAKLLLQDFGLAGKRDVVKDILPTAIPTTEQDVVVVFVTASGLRNGQRTQVSFARKVYAQSWAGQPMTAIQITTASGICTVVDLVVQGRAAARPALHAVRSRWRSKICL